MTCPFADEQGAYETRAPILGFDPNDPPNDGSGSRSTIITSQFPTETWHDQLGDHTTADAICDPIISPQVITMSGTGDHDERYRHKRSPAPGSSPPSWTGRQSSTIQRSRGRSSSAHSIGEHDGVYVFGPDGVKWRYHRGEQIPIEG